MPNIIYIKKYFTEKFDRYIDRIDYLKVDKYACTNRNIFYSDGQLYYSKITNRVINIRDFSYIIFVNPSSHDSPRFIVKLRDLTNYKDAEDKLQELIEYYTSADVEKEMAVVRMELDYWLLVLNDALSDGDEDKITEAKQKLDDLRHQAMVMEML